MRLTLTENQRAELEAAATAEPRVRRGKRCRAVLLRAEGMTVAAVAQTLGCSQASVCATAAWRQDGAVGLREGDHGGGQVKLGAAEETVLVRLLDEDPQARGHRATGWTVPLWQGELAQRGAVVGERTIRRGHERPVALHRLGYRWKRPQSVLGRPDPAYDEKKGP